MTQPETFDPLIDDKPSRYVVGIDLGTTNSAVTFIDTDEVPWKIRVLSIPQLVASSETESLDTLPSYYFQPVQSGDQRSGDQKSGDSLRLPWDKKSPKFCVGSYARDETAKTSGRGIASAKSWLCHTAVDTQRLCCLGTLLAMYNGYPLLKSVVSIYDTSAKPGVNNSLTIHWRNRISCSRCLLRLMRLPGN